MLYLILILIILYFYLTKTNETFWNEPLRSTRNMSYDLRGEAYLPPRINYPFNNSELN